MNYEQKYKEALKDMRIIYPNLKGDAKLAAEHAFPELAESEDERIRRTLVEYFGPMAQLDLVRGVPIQKIRDWLEKQKEPHYTKRNALFDKCVANCDPEIMKKVSDEIDSQLKKEQKPAEWSKEDKNRLEEAIEVVEANGCWVRSDDAVKQVSDFLKSLPERFNLQPKQEWSEEDAMFMDELESYILYDKEFNDEQKSWRIKRLKSLRPSKDCSNCAKHLEGYISGRSDAENKLLEQFGALITPEGELHIKPRWKPSEEQMKVFEGLYHNYILDSKDYETLDLLYNDLKKLI